MFEADCVPNNHKHILLQMFDHIFDYSFFFCGACDPTRVMTSSFLRFSRSHTTTHHSRQDSSGRVISSSQRSLPDNTKHSQQTNIHAPRCDSNPRSQQASGHRPTSETARPLGPAYWVTAGSIKRLVGPNEVSNRINDHLHCEFNRSSVNRKRNQKFDVSYPRCVDLII